MFYLKNISSAVVIFGVVLSFAAAGAETEKSTLPKAPYILTQTVKEWLKEGKKIGFVDVRAAKEYEAGHIEGAVNIPYNQMESHAGEISRDTPQVFYCTYSAWRAPYAANTLADLGFINVCRIRFASTFLSCCWNFAPMQELC